MDYNNVIELDEVTLEDCIDLYEKKNVKKETFTQTSLFELSESEVEAKTNPIEEKVKEIKDKK